MTEFELEQEHAGLAKRGVGVCAPRWEWERSVEGAVGVSAGKMHGWRKSGRKLKESNLKRCKIRDEQKITEKKKGTRTEERSNDD